ncbi:hypothetical protein ALC56_02559 [Trachymyrmex septentrionalis]|uniref:H15 domain-containing protein n=1 Tax=Trachymyrmex septentrionalis TaxID=34720 RepID=A0A195FR48_9HYME|nr:PREDICTED: uncharacterized protein LOC108745495 [Trachymyrmex septentrionalis]KYN42757.1 hypothetical protein ALC56_02559 [Trachymyrmex septentrionalis]
MVRRSALVYDLLRTEQPSDGFSKKEILTHISDKYDIVVGKTLRRDVTVALRRGLDFGILAKKRNKFRFNPDFYQTTNSRRNILSATTRKNTNTKKRKRNSKKKATGRSNITKGQQRRRSPNRGRGRDRKQLNPEPQPKLPRPPSWSPKRRLLIAEPIPKVKYF